MASNSEVLGNLSQELKDSRVSADKAPVAKATPAKAPVAKAPAPEK